MVFQHALMNSLVRNGERTAIEQGARRLTYAELRRAAGKVTAFLLKEGLGPESVVGVEIHDRPDLICVITGVINSRCLFVAIDDSLPAARFSGMIRNLDLGWVISSRKEGRCRVADEFPGVRHYYLEDILEAVTEEEAAEAGHGDCVDAGHGQSVEAGGGDGDDASHADWVEAGGGDGVDAGRGDWVDAGRADGAVAGHAGLPAYSGDDGIYVYFTSGSTGTPKGIVGKNKSLLQFLQWEIDSFAINEESRVSQFISPYFDAFLRDVFVPLLAGGVICIPPDEEDLLTPGKMPGWIDGARITHIHCVPSLFRVINGGALSADMFPSLAVVLLSGEKIIPAELGSWYALFGSRILLVNLYGPTETTMIRSYYKIRPEDVRRDRIPIGHAIRDSRLLVLNRDMKPCSALAPGELYILSDYMTKGYLNAPELTREKFVGLDVFGKTGVLAYRTGDTARLLADGKIDLIGREDRQVKIGGIRVELDEIEAVLVRSGLVRNAVVIRHGEAGREVLTAFIIVQPEWQGRTDLTGKVLDYAKGRLPAYMMPSELVEVNRYPLLSNGKLNYQELLKTLTTSRIVLPANETEERLVAIWKGMLGDKPISTEESFLRAGGNSLSIMRLIGIIYNEFNIRVSLSELFNNLTVQKQAALIAAAKQGDRLVIGKAPVRDHYHLSAAQERLYFHYELDRESTAFNLPMAWELEPGMGKERVARILEQLAERHESLRTSFRFVEGKPVQHIEPAVHITIEEIGVGVRVAAALAGFVRPFALDKAPLMRCGIAEAGDGRRILLVDMHHIICDGMSQLQLLSDFIRLSKGEELAAPGIQYKDYAEWEYAYRKTDEYMAHREFWLDSFEGGAPKLRLPVQAAGLVPAGAAGENLRFSIEREKVEPMLEELREGGITVFSGLFAVYFLWLSQLTGQDDLIAGTNTAGRVQEALEGVVGMFAKTLPIRFKADAELTFKELAAGLHGRIVAAHARQIYDLSDIVRAVNKGREEGGGELVEAMFVFQNFADFKGHAGNAGGEAVGFDTPAKFPITLFASEDDAAFHFRFEYSPAYFSAADMQLLAGQFTALLSRVGENPRGRMVEFADARPRVRRQVEEALGFNF